MPGTCEGPTTHPRSASRPKPNAVNMVLKLMCFGHSIKSNVLQVMKEIGARKRYRTLHQLKGSGRQLLWDPQWRSVTASGKVCGAYHWAARRTVDQLILASCYRIYLNRCKPTEWRRGYDMPHACTPVAKAVCTRRPCA